MVEIIDQSMGLRSSAAFADCSSSESGAFIPSFECRYVDGKTEKIVIPDSESNENNATNKGGKDEMSLAFGRSEEPLFSQSAMTSLDAAPIAQAPSLLPTYGPNGAELLLAAKRLRTECFAVSYGAVFTNDLDSDEYDEACLHIILQDKDRVIATARVLDSQRAALLGRFYSENEFHLTPLLKHYPYQVLEVGRTCIHPDYRNGKVLRRLWQAITHIAKHLNVNAFIGCCSIPIGAGDVDGWLSSLDSVPKLNIKPKYRLPATLLSSDIVIPPLLSTYLKMGASVSEQACFDVAFHCADVLVWLPFEQVNPRYQHLL